MSLTATSLDAFEAAIAPFRGDAVPDGEAYQRLSGMAIAHPLAADLARLDPFSAAYRDGAMALYRALSGRADGYEPARDEQTHTPPPPNLWTDLPPWSFRQPALVAEFLLSWGHILRLLDAPPGASVLEYGSGSGQLLLTLARAGLRTHGVDIDPPSVGATRQQAEALGLSVEIEQAPFGEGFAGRRFDRIVFFEAFHHAWDFERLLERLHDRLEPGGRIVFCGEPIVPAPLVAIPFPWGPRLDALSVLCMRRWGWMELGFQHGFFVRALRRAGWRATLHPAPAGGGARATAYVAEPAEPTLLRLGEPRDMGRHAAGWGPPEGAHRRARGAASVLPLPPGWSAKGSARVALRVANLSPAAARLAVEAGRRSVAADLAPGEERTVELDAGGASELVLRNDRGAEEEGVAVLDAELLEPVRPASADAVKANLVPLLKEIGRPLWHRLPEGARTVLRKRLPR